MSREKYILYQTLIYVFRYDQAHVPFHGAPAFVPLHARPGLPPKTPVDARSPDPNKPAFSGHEFVRSFKRHKQTEDPAESADPVQPTKLVSV